MLAGCKESTRVAAGGLEDKLPNAALPPEDVLGVMFLCRDCELSQRPLGRLLNFNKASLSQVPGKEMPRAARNQARPWWLE